MIRAAIRKQRVPILSGARAHGSETNVLPASSTVTRQGLRLWQRVGDELAGRLLLDGAARQFTPDDLRRSSQTQDPSDLRSKSADHATSR